jgi:hypothetical protein
MRRISQVSQGVAQPLEQFFLLLLLLLMLGAVPTLAHFYQLQDAESCFPGMFPRIQVLGT